MPMDATGCVLSLSHGGNRGSNPLGDASPTKGGKFSPTHWTKSKPCGVSFALKHVEAALRPNVRSIFAAVTLTNTKAGAAVDERRAKPLPWPPSGARISASPNCKTLSDESAWRLRAIHRLRFLSAPGGLFFALCGSRFLRCRGFGRGLFGRSL